jgi:hypothetical protein
MDTGYRSGLPQSDGKGSRTQSSGTQPARLVEVAAMLARQQLPELPPGAADRIRHALAAESADRAAAASESRTPVRLPQPRSGRECPPLIRLVPRPRQAPDAARR